MQQIDFDGSQELDLTELDWWGRILLWWHNVTHEHKYAVKPDVGTFACCAQRFGKLVDVRYQPPGADYWRVVPSEVDVAELIKCNTPGEVADMLGQGHV